jgi:hypothetical protein
MLLVIMNAQRVIDREELKIKKLEDERRSLVYEMEFALTEKENFFEGCRQTLLSIQTDDGQRDKISERINSIQVHVQGEMSVIKKSYGERLKSIQTELMALYLDSFMDEEG